MSEKDAPPAPVERMSDEEFEPIVTDTSLWTHQDKPLPKLIVEARRAREEVAAKDAEIEALKQEYLDHREAAERRNREAGERILTLNAEVERLKDALEKLECWNQMESGKNCTILASERKGWSKCQVCIAREALGKETK